MSPYSLLRALLFRLQPERAHGLALDALRLAATLPGGTALLRRRYTCAPTHPVEAFGLRFPNPIGLAAGYDKDGIAWRGLGCLGFGHVEIGTVTPRPQPGNPRPRVFRVPEARALINRMGFPSQGAAAVARRLSGPRPAAMMVGVNLGKNLDTPVEEAARDYLELVDIFSTLADYLTINVSSPNTVGLRRLQARDALEALLGAITARVSERAAAGGGRPVPVLVKLAPDLSQEELDDAVGAAIDRGAAGLIATNTTLSREGIRSSVAAEAGGLSGPPLRARSTEVVRSIVARAGGRMPVVAAGGVADADSAREKLDAGAALVQVYTGLIYRGPGLVRDILRGLA